MQESQQRWIEELDRRGKGVGQPLELTEEEKALVGLHRLGFRFMIEAPQRTHQQRRTILLLLLTQLVLSQQPSLFGYPLSDVTAARYGVNLSFLVFPILAWYLHDRQSNKLGWYLIACLALAIIVNYLYTSSSAVLEVGILHLGMFGCLSLALFEPQRTLARKLTAYLKLVGEALLLTFLLACGTLITFLLANLLFLSIGWRFEAEIGNLLFVGILPLLPLTAVHLLSTSQAMLKPLINLLAKLFLPIFAAVMACFLIALLFSRFRMISDRTLLLGIDIMLALILLMVISCVELSSSKQWRVMLIITCTFAFLLDVAALAAIGNRLGQFGLSPNRLAALAENVLLIANLSALVFVLTTHRPVEKMQSYFLLGYAAWFLDVVLLFPLLF